MEYGRGLSKMPLRLCLPDSSITQSVFKTGANEGFRRFGWNKNPFSVRQVSDMSLLLPFENATNRTAVLIALKGEITEYPVSYLLWLPKLGRSHPMESELATVLADTEIHDWLASPVEPSVPESTWFTSSSRAFPILRRMIGDRSAALMERTYAGSCTWLNGAFWI